MLEEATLSPPTEGLPTFTGRVAIPPAAAARGKNGSAGKESAKSFGMHEDTLQQRSGCTGPPLLVTRTVRYSDHQFIPKVRPTR